MKHFFWAGLFGFAALLLCWGCVPRASVTAPAAETPPAAAAPVVAPPENSYFFFTEAQFRRQRGDLTGAVQYLRRAIEMDGESVYLKRELAAVYIDLNEHDNALGVLEEILANTGDDLETLEIYGALNQRLKRMERAREAYETIIAGEGGGEETYTRLGRIYMAEENWDDALRVFRLQLERFPGSILAAFYLGRVHVERGELEAAEAAFEKTLQLDPELLEPRFELLDILRGRRRAAGAGAPADDGRIVDLYEGILAENPGNVRALAELGLFFDEIGRKAEAEDLLAELGRRSVDEQVVMSTLIRLYFETGRNRELETLLRYMQIGAPQSSDLAYVSGLNFNALDDRGAAVEAFQAVEPDSRFYGSAAVNIAMILQDENRLDEAVEHLRAAGEKMPENAEFKLYLGSLLEEKGDYAGAVEALEAGIDLQPDNTKLHFRLGVVYDKWGRRDDCIAAMREVVRLDPEHANALNYLGYTFADMGIRLDEAEELILRALEQKPNDGYITDSLGWVYYRKGLYEKALEYLEKAAALAADDPVVLEHLGDVHRRLGNREKALESYRRSLEKKGDNAATLEEKIRELEETRPADP